LEFIFVLTVGLIAGAISGIIGTGSSIMLVPVLVWQFGPKEAVPIMAVAAIIGNFSRILVVARDRLAGDGRLFGHGTFLSRRFVVKLDAESFRYMLDGLMLVSGLAMLWNAFFS
jgi:uncharacterized membrane protein YfcA